MSKELTDQEAVETFHRGLNHMIDKWHASNSEETLASYLGMSEEGYARFVKDPEAFIRRLLGIQDEQK